MKWLFGIVLAAIVVVGGYAGYLYYYKFDAMLSQVGTTEKVPAGMSAKEKPLAFLMLGVDSRPGSDGSLNTDVIMVTALNPVTKSAVVVSIPRDTYMAGNRNVRSGKANMFYAALHAQSSNTSKEQLKEMFGDYLDTTIDYMATLNFNGFQDVIDALDGVTVDVDMDMRYVDEADGTDINLRKGTQTLSGKQALDFVRYRKSNRGTAESNDMQRNARQQEVIAAIIGKLKSGEGIMKLGQVFDALGGNLTTDIPKNQIKTLLTTYLGIDRDKIQYIHLDGEWRSPYVYVQPSDVARARQALQQTLK